MRMGMPDTDDGMTAIQVKVLHSFVVPNLTTLSLYDIHVKQGIYVK
jgi:hypothetical protein